MLLASNNVAANGRGGLNVTAMNLLLESMLIDQMNHQ